MRTIYDPYRGWRLRYIEILQEARDVLATVEPQGVLGTVQVQTPPLSINGEVVPIWGKLHCLRLYPVWIAKVCQSNLVGDSERFFALLC